ncbi:hypothetical protein UlMin_005726 [Ulmus minor]
MAKKKRATEMRKSEKKVDHIPKCSQQRRSSPPKRRTDFSHFFRNSSSLPNSGNELRVSSLVGCSKSQEEGSGFSTNIIESSIVDVELVDQNDSYSEALQWRECETSGELFKGSAGSNDADEQDCASDKSTLSTSRRAEEEFIERGRGKRERKPKLHFDEIAYLMKPDRKVRRLRIMRHLGLTPPAGSPFKNCFQAL